MPSGMAIGRTAQKKKEHDEKEARLARRRAQQEEELDGWFEKFDINHDKQFDRNELKELCVPESHLCVS